MLTLVQRPSRFLVISAVIKDVVRKDIAMPRYPVPVCLGALNSDWVPSEVIGQ